RYVSAVSRERRDQLAFRNAPGRRARARPRLAWHVCDERRASLGPAPFDSIRDYHSGAHHDHHRRNARALRAGRAADLHEGSGVVEHARAKACARGGPPRSRAALAERDRKPPGPDTHAWCPARWISPELIALCLLQ